MNKYTKTKIDVAKVILLYNSGMTQKEVGQEMNLSQKIIFGRLKDAGIKCRIAAPRCQTRENNKNWKGKIVTYAAFHYRLKALKGKPMLCENCGTTDLSRTYDWANMTGKYDDPNDYKRLCRSCHWKYDKKQSNFKGAVGGRPSRGVISNA